MAKKTLHEIVQEHKDTILKGTLLAIDPSCGSSHSDPAFAFFKEGKLVESGAIILDCKADIYTKLREQFSWLEDKYGVDVDILALEKIRKGHTHLRWACVIPMIACFSSTIIEVHPMVWHRFVPKDYVKSDEKDAIVIGLTLIAIASGKSKIELGDWYGKRTKK
jgi:hypothetical protein